MRLSTVDKQVPTVCMHCLLACTTSKHQFAVLLGIVWVGLVGTTMDKPEDLELEENSKSEENSKWEEISRSEAEPRQNEDFEDLLTELGGFGKYQKRLLCLLTPFLFMTIPLLQNNQVREFAL